MVDGSAERYMVLSNVSNKIFIDWFWGVNVCAVIMYIVGCEFVVMFNVFPWFCLLCGGFLELF